MNEFPDDDEVLLARFRQWLRDARADAEELDSDGEPPPEPGEPEVGLYRLIEEFTALRHEVKLQTKGSRGLQEQAEALLPALRQAIEQFRAVGPKEEQAAQAAGRPLAEALADLDEALDRGRAEVEKARPRLVTDPAGTFGAELDALFDQQSWFRRPWLRAYHERVRDLVDRREAEPRPGLAEALLEGYDLIRARLARALESAQIRRIDAVGEPVDPGRMAVVALVDAPDRPPGSVVDEVRRGYTWRGRVLRFAEVRAARAPAPGSTDQREGDDTQGNGSQVFEG